MMSLANRPLSREAVETTLIEWTAAGWLRRLDSYEPSIIVGVFVHKLRAVDHHLIYSHYLA